MSSEHIHFFFELRNQLKLHHWQTKIYARHVAIDGILSELEKGIDAFVEVYIGKYGRPLLRGAKANITLKNLSESAAVQYVKNAVNYILGPLTRSLHDNDADLFNIRDELVNHLNQLLYLFRLH
jgi:hypothetical protein